VNRYYIIVVLIGSLLAISAWHPPRPLGHRYLHNYGAKLIFVGANSFAPTSGLFQTAQSAVTITPYWIHTANRLLKSTN
jgi:hypothetical protein